MITIETPPMAVRRARRKITYTWEEYLAVIQMMGDGNTIQDDDFEILPPKPTPPPQNV